MKAISLWQPFASLMGLRLKGWETRSWSTEHRGPIAIHATKRWDAAIFECIEDPAIKTAFDSVKVNPWVLPLGCILGIGKITEVVSTNMILFEDEVDEVQAVRPLHPKTKILPSTERAFGNYASNRFAWRIELLQIFKDPIPAKGCQRLWNWTPPPEINFNFNKIISSTSSEKDHP